MFVIEGADQCGKTTLAHKLVERISPMRPVFYAHMSRPPECWDYYDDYLMRAQMYAVQDRFHYGGLVYADLRRGGTKITPMMLHLLESHLDLQGTFRVVLTAEDSFLRAKMKKAKDEGRKEMYDEVTVLEVNRLFFELGTGVKYKTARPDIHYHITGPTDGSVHEVGYPNDDVIADWANQWLMRLRAVEEFEGGNRMKRPFRHC